MLTFAANGRDYLGVMFGNSTWTWTASGRDYLGVILGNRRKALLPQDLDTNSLNIMKEIFQNERPEIDKIEGWGNGMGGTKAVMPFSHNVNPSMYDVIIYVYLGLAYDMAFIHFTTKQLVISRLMLCSVKDR